uniref:Ribosomal protein L33 n=1 Tax=Gentiana aristata TaxID=50749 RepID=A0A8F4XNQ1_9GENT|nr:ribosomal protein L33 [Gentiana aristata]
MRVEGLSKEYYQGRFMAKGKDGRVTMIFECTICARNNVIY